MKTDIISRKFGPLMYQRCGEISVLTFRSYHLYERVGSVIGICGIVVRR